MPARAQAQAQAEAPLAPVEQKPSRSGFLINAHANVIMTCQTGRQHQRSAEVLLQYQLDGMLWLDVPKPWVICQQSN